MCGIAGLVGDFVPDLMLRMNALQAHRGPDGNGVFEDVRHEISLGHVRLSILDLTESASQPMYSSDGRYVLSFNGEIYNFQQLRELLDTDREPLRSSGDTEVLLRGLQQYGYDFVQRLNGMFALALWDRQRRELLLARDQLGVKPIYYSQPKPGCLLFASEIKALCAHPDLQREPDFETIQQHLGFSYGTTTRTAIRGVFRLPPASTLVWQQDRRQFRIRRYWQAEYSTYDPKKRFDALARLRETVDASVRRQLISDVRVGSFLSGGLDSSLVTACAARDASSGFTGYTISYSADENRLDQAHADAPYARRFAKQLNLNLQEIEIEANVASLWPELIYHLDEPIADPAAITCYLISKLARDHGSTVLLSGQGADELFGGYPRYRAMQLSSVSEWLPLPLRQAIASAAHWLPGAWAGRSGANLRRVRRVLLETNRTPAERFLAYCLSTPQSQIGRVLSQDVQASLDAEAAAPCLERIDSSTMSLTDRFLDRDLSVYLPNHNLLYTDKMGMAVGVEARVPLLDVELTNLATTFPTTWKIKGKILKSILREAARGTIPDEIIDRPKAGFGAPYRKWLRHDLGDLWLSVSSATAVSKRGWFDSDGLAAARKMSQSGRADLYMLQWAVLTTELWARQFIDANPANRVTDHQLNEMRGCSKSINVA